MKWNSRTPAKARSKLRWNDSRSANSLKLKNKKKCSLNRKTRRMASSYPHPESDQGNPSQTDGDPSGPRPPVAIRLHFRLKRLHYNLKSRRGPFGGRFLGRFFTISSFPNFRAEFEIGMEFIPTARATHEHSPNICRDTKRLMTSFAIFDDVIFHRYFIGKGVVTIKQKVATI